MEFPGAGVELSQLPSAGVLNPRQPVKDVTLRMVAAVVQVPPPAVRTSRACDAWGQPVRGLSQRTADFRRVRRCRPRCAYSAAAGAAASVCSAYRACCADALATAARLGQARSCQAGTCTGMPGWHMYRHGVTLAGSAPVCTGAPGHPGQDAAVHGARLLIASWHLSAR